MKNVLIYCEKKFRDPLLNNSPFFTETPYYDCSENQIHSIMSSHNITIQNKKLSSKGFDEYEVIIIDDLEDYDSENTSSLYFFIQPIDFNISDPFIVNRWPESATDSTFKNKIEWANSHFPNLIFLGSNIFESPNQIFDLSLVLNLNNHNDNWGKYHYLSDKLFESIRQKSFRLDYCFREVKKENRVKFLLDLIDTLDEKQFKDIKISAHGGFLNDEKYYNDVREFFESRNHFSLFSELIKLDKRFFSFDELLNIKAGCQAWPINKLMYNTLSSDIAIYYETAREIEGVPNTMNDLITEKTIDLLNIRKPFIHLSKNVDIFLEKFGFINYNKEIFDLIDVDRLTLIQKILDMKLQDYEVLIENLRNSAAKNRELLDYYYKNNTFIFKLVYN